MAALATIYEQYRAVVLGAALRVTADHAMAEDITQIVFIELWRRPEMYDPRRGSLRPWLTTVAHHRGVDCVRSAERTRRREAMHAQDMAAEDVPDLDDMVVAALDADLLRVALARLPHDQRVPIGLAFLGGRSYRAVASELGIAEGTTKSRIRSGMRHLTSFMHENGAVASH